MNAIIEIDDTGDERGWRWTVTWPTGRHDHGFCSREFLCHTAIAESLEREYHSRQLHAWYDANSHRDCGD